MHLDGSLAFNYNDGDEECIIINDESWGFDEYNETAGTSRILENTDTDALLSRHGSLWPSNDLQLLNGLKFWLVKALVLSEA